MPVDRSGSSPVVDFRRVAVLLVDAATLELPYARTRLSALLAAVGMDALQSGVSAEGFRGLLADTAAAYAEELAIDREAALAELRQFRAEVRTEKLLAALHPEAKPTMPADNPHAEVPKKIIYVFLTSPESRGDVTALAVAEDGDEIAFHISSSVGFAKYDMGLNEHPTGGRDGQSLYRSPKHKYYAQKYPEGYELVWVDDWKTHPSLSEQARRNRDAATARKEGPNAR